MSREINFSFNINFSSEEEKLFYQWYNKEKPDPKELMLIGYRVLTTCISSYYHNYYRDNYDIELLKKHKIQLDEQDKKWGKICEDRDGEHQQECLQIQEIHQKELDKIRSEKRYEIWDLQKNNDDLKLQNCNYETKFSTIKEDIEKLSESKWKTVMLNDRHHLEKEIIKKDTIIESKDEMISHQKSEIVMLSNEKNNQENQELKNQIQQLKNSNAVKGTTGEFHLSTNLKKIFNNLTVIDKSKTSHCGDIHVIDPDGNHLIFESKYKMSIEKSDVSKFEADIVNLIENGSPVIGGVFVSFLTPNIPHKGNLFFDVNSTKIPLLYVGFDSTIDFEVHFEKIILLFRKFCLLYENTDVKPENNQYIVLLKSLLLNMSKTKGRIQQCKTDFSKSLKSINDLENDYQDQINQISQNIPDKQNTKFLHHCPKCNQGFTNKKDLPKHVKQCNS